MRAAGILGAATIVAVLFASAPVQAQRTGTRIGRDATSQDAKAAIQILADCVVARRPGLARNLLRTLPGTPEESGMMRAEQEDFGLCLDSNELVLDGMELRFTSRLLRTPLARALVRRALPNAPTTLPIAVDSEPWFMARFNTLPADADVNRDHLTLLDFGHCIAVHEWSGTRDFLLSEEGSAEERAAITRLVPVLGPCLTDDMSLQITPALLRDVLVEPVYQVLANAEQSAAATE